MLLLMMMVILSVVYLSNRHPRVANVVNECPIPSINENDLNNESHTEECSIIETEEEIRAKEKERLRREYREWIENCNYLFGKERPEIHEQKVCKRTIDGAA